MTTGVRAAIALGVSGLLALSLVGCSPSKGGQPGAVELKVWSFLSEEGTSPREVVLKQLIDEFESANPGVTVTVEAQPVVELESKFLTAAQRGDAPDLIWARDTFLAQLYDAGALANLDELLSSEFSSSALPDMFEVFTDKAVFDSQRIALPLWPTPAQVLFYRADLIQEQGAEGLPLEWKEFTRLAAALTDGSDTYGFGFPANDADVSAYLNLMNGFSVSPFDPTNGRFDLLGPESVRVAETFRELAQSGAMPADLVTATGQDIQDQFGSGRYATAMAFGGRFTVFQESAAGYSPDVLRVSAWPSFDQAQESALLGPYWNVGVWSGSERAQEATAFLESLYSLDASRLWAQTAGQVPDRRSVLDDPFFSGDGTVIADFASIIASPTARVLPQRLENPAKLTAVLNAAIQRLISTETPVDQILTEAKVELGW